MTLPAWHAVLRLALAPLLLAASGAAAESGPYEDAGLDLRISVSEQYDDNVNFANGDLETEQDDWVTRIRPYVAYRKAHEGHLFSVDARADYRFGADTDLNEFNGNLGGAADLHFDGGLGLRLFDVFTHTSFDQAIFEEEGTTQSDTNTFGVGASYVPGERFELRGRYDRTDQTFDDDVGTGDRTLQAVEGTVGVPIGQTFVAYAVGHYADQDSTDRPDRRYEDRRIVGGVRFLGPRRFTMWAQAGWEKIEFDDPLGPQFDEVVGEAGVDIRFTDSTIGRFSAGRDGYANFVYAGALEYKHEDRQRVSFLFSRSTQNSFTVGSASPLFEVTILRSEVESRLGSSWVANGEVALFWYGEVAGLPYDDNTTGTVLGSLLYALNQWLEVGGHYQYARRVSDRELREYTVNRAGGTVRLRW